MVFIQKAIKYLAKCVNHLFLSFELGLGYIPGPTHEIEPLFSEAKRFISLITKKIEINRKQLPGYILQIFLTNGIIA